jgi:hypothetical protein
MQKIILFAAMLLSLFVQKAVAQDYSVNGNVSDKANGGIASASVLLLNPADSSLVSSSVTDSTGSFTIEHVARGSYLAKIAADGYSELTQPLEVNSTMTISYSLNKNTTLNEVVVTNKKPFIESSFGKTTLNLNATSISAGSSALDILRKSPGVKIDGNGNVLLNGNGVLVLIDEKQTYLSGKDLEEYLKSLSAEQLVQVELMTQPSAKYDKEGGGGIINLKTTQIKKRGGNAILTSSVSFAQRVHPATRSNLNLNYNTEKWSLFANAGYLHIQGFLDQQINRDIKDLQTQAMSTVNENGFYKETFEDYNLHVGGDYKVNKKTTIGASAKGIYHPNRETDELYTTLTDDQNIVTITKGLRTHEHHKNSVMGNAYVTYVPDEKTNLSVNADYILRDQYTHLLMANSNYNQQMEPVPGALTALSETPLRIDLYSLKADYTKDINDKTKLEAGIKSSLADIDNENDFQVLANNTWQHDTLRSNHFIYRENINAAYASLSRKFTDKLDAQIGLRAENTQIEGIQKAGGRQFSRSFTALFPTAFIGYKFNDKHSVELNYGKRIERPAYNSLNPFIQYASQYQYETGNPGLLPSYSHTIELKHNYNNMLFTGLELRRRTNVVNPVVTYDPASNTVIFSSANNADKNIAHLSSYYTKDLFSWWNFAASADMYYQAYKLKGNSEIYADAVAYALGVNSQFKVSKSVSIDTSYQYSSRDLQSMIDRNRPMQWLSISISKKVLKDTASVKLSFEDPLNAYRYDYVSNWNGVETAFANKYLSQQVSVGFTYNFGKLKEDIQRNNSAVEEAKRL